MIVYSSQRNALSNIQDSTPATVRKLLNLKHSVGHNRNSKSQNVKQFSIIKYVHPHSSRDANDKEVTESNEKRKKEATEKMHKLTECRINSQYNTIATQEYEILQLIEQNINQGKKVRNLKTRIVQMKCNIEELKLDNERFKNNINQNINSANGIEIPRIGETHSNVRDARTCVFKFLCTSICKLLSISRKSVNVSPLRPNSTL